MKFALPTFALLALMLGSCTPTQEELTPDAHWTATSQDRIKMQVLPYVAKLPKNATHETKFDSVYLPYYKGLMDRFTWRHVYPDGADGFYFSLERPAASLYDKKVLIVGRLRYDEARDTLLAYEEAFWTFKMTQDELAARGDLLFGRYIAGKSLDAYLPEVAQEEYIEFPDANNRYDTRARRWVFGGSGPRPE